MNSYEPDGLNDMTEKSEKSEKKIAYGIGGEGTGNGVKRDSLQALRGLAFAGIFLGHFYYFGWTPVSVSVFFILSGFLLTVKKNSSYESYSLADSFKEALRRISKLYPLHIIMMLVSIPFVIYRAGGVHLSDLMIKIGCNVLLIQSLVPSADINASLNGVSWFLSTLFVLYILFPFLYRMFKKIRGKHALLLVIVAGIALQTLYVYVVGLTVKSADVMTYLIHSSPLYRIFDMSYGILLGLIVQGEGYEDSGKRSVTISVTEAIILAATALLVYIWSKDSMIVYLSYAPVCPLISVIWVRLFAGKAGVITRLLTNRVTVFLGDRSGSAFLIHFPIVVYINTFIFPYLTVLKRTIIHGILFPGSVILTLVLSYLYDRWSASRRSTSIGKVID